MNCTENGSERNGCIRELLREQHAQLAAELTAPEYAALLGRINTSFASWKECAEAVKRTVKACEAQDMLLRAILTAYADGRDPRWQTVMLGLFWPALEKIAALKRSWDANAEDQWANILFAFVKAVSACDTRRRQAGFYRKIVNDTLHTLFRIYEQQWKWAAREAATSVDELIELAGNEDWSDFAAVDLAADCHALEDAVRGSGLLVGEQELWLQTRLRGRNLAEYAARAGVSHDAARKQRQRIEQSPTGRLLLTQLRNLAG